MKIFILAVYFCIISISTNSGDKETPRNYEERQVMPQIFAKDIKGKSTSSSRNKSTVNITGTQKQKNINAEGPSIFETKHLGDTLFYESFSGKSLDNDWLFDSSIDNMEGYIDSKMGKVMKVTNKYEGDSFLKFNYLASLKGKKIRLEGWVKTENISGGSKDYEVGKLRLSYQIGQKIVYENSEGLLGTKDWQKIKAREDGSTTIDDAKKGSYIFFVPENAENIELLLGLQNCKGAIYFKDIVLLEIKD